MRLWEFSIKCLVCGANIRLNRIEKHRNRKHPDISADEFQAKLVSSVRNDPSILDTNRVVRSAADINGTKALMQAGKHTKRVTSVIFGGAIGLGKRN